MAITLEQKVNSNFILKKILIKIKDNSLLEQYKIKDNKGVYIFIYKIVVDDIKLFLNYQKNELEKSTKYMLHTVLNYIFPKKYDPLKKIYELRNEELLFDKEFVLYYLNVLNNMKDIHSEKTDRLFDFEIPYYVDWDEEAEEEAIGNEMTNQDHLFQVIIYILGENAYNFIENMKNQKQNTIQKTELETIFNKRKLPEDIQKKILEFSYNKIIDSCK